MVKQLYTVQIKSADGSFRQINIGGADTSFAAAAAVLQKASSEAGAGAAFQGMSVNGPILDATVVG